MNTASGTRGNRQGSAPILHSFPLDFNAVSGTAVKLCVVRASVAKPAYVEVSAIINIASNAGTTSVLSVGITGAGYTDMLNGVDLKGAANVAYPASNAVIKRVYTADTTIFGIVTAVGTAATAGLAYVMVKTARLSKQAIPINA